MDLDGALTPSGKSFNYKAMEVGGSVQGTLLGKPEILKDLKYQTNEQAVDSKGNLKWTLKLSIEIEGEERTLYLVNSAYWAGILAFQEAKTAAGGDLEYPGGLFGLKREEDGKAKPGMYAPKNYVAKFVPANAV